MRIVTLIEDTCGGNGCEAEHGLSFYIETAKHKLLVDCGATDLLLRNAERLGVDLTQVDTVILSHGHYDHAGGILPFAARNNRAAIYASERVGGAYYSLSGGAHFIGIDPRILELEQLHPVSGEMQLDEELFLFSGAMPTRYPAKANLKLQELVDGVLVQDRFLHEQYLVIAEGERRILLSGCAHCGILNILDRDRELFGKHPDVVISGFHMVQAEGYTEAERREIEAIARELKETGAEFYTGHCTGAEAGAILQSVMGQQVHLLHSGMQWELEA